VTVIDGLLAATAMKHNVAGSIVYGSVIVAAYRTKMEESREEAQSPLGK
jgi:hypothetical protein